VSEHVAIQRVQGGIVEVGLENAFAEIVEHHRTRLCEGPDYAKEVRAGPVLRVWSSRDLRIIRG
jgi:hypothetical protein